MASGIDANSIDLEKCKGLLLTGLSKKHDGSFQRIVDGHRLLSIPPVAIEIYYIQQQQQQHHNSLPLTEVGKLYLEELLLKLLSSLLSSQPKTVQEHHPGMEKHVTLMFSGVLEYMASDILKLTTNYARNIASLEIFDQDIKIAMFADNVLMEVFHPDDDFEELVAVPDIPNLNEGVTGLIILIGERKISYESLVRDFMSDEASYLRDLSLIIKVIKKKFDEAPNIFSEQDVDAIFSNILDLAELSENLIGLLEEAVEMTDESCPVPLVGSCFEDLALECSFELYSDYTIARMSKEWRETFDRILSPKTVTTYLQNVYNGFRDVVVYVLPNLLLAPIYHCFYYLEQIELLEKNSPDAEDKQCFIQALSAVTPIKPVLEANTQNLPKLRPSEASLRKSWRGGPNAIQMSDIEKSIDGWWGVTITQSCNEFLYEGSLQRVGKGNKRYSDRHVFLFDSLLISCKSNQARLPTVAAQNEYRLKERILIRKATVRDIIGDEESKYRFEVVDGEKNEVHVFHARTVADKQAWMSHLVRLRYRSTFDRMLDQIVREEAANQQLRLPSPEKYRFAEPDSPENLILEETADQQVEARTQVDLIKGGTVLKLVERLTYHKYSDPSFTKTFLTTFRSFCKPKELLDLLIERYRIPEPPLTEEQQMAIDRGELPNKEDLKRFREEYVKPIQLRVMNVIRQWLEHHWYDFERDRELLAEVEEFISSVRGKNMKKWAKTMQKIISRKRDCEDPQSTVEFNDSPPAIQWHLTTIPAKFSLFTLHPIEIARQLTLIEFDLYRKVQPSEMIGSVWTKVGKETNSPNLLKMIHFSTKITRWVSKSLIEIDNLSERHAATCRAIEVMQVMKRLNNFNGLLEFVSAFSSAAVHRLNFTKEALSDHFSKALKDCMDMCDGRLTKMLQRLQSIDPPCVPFVAKGWSVDLLGARKGLYRVIVFRRKVADIMLQVQQYQNLPYNLEVVPPIRDFFLNLDPLEGRTEKEFNDHLFHSSLKIEPREVERPPKFNRQFSDKEIKSPGIHGKRNVSRTTTKEEIKNFEKSNLIRRQSSLRSEPSIKRHSLFEPPITKPMSFDTMSVRNLPLSSTESVQTPSPREENPPPRPPPRDPRANLVSAPPVITQQSKFNFDDPLSRVMNMSASRYSPVPQTPATAPPRSMTSDNGVQNFEPMQSSAPPPIPPRDRVNGAYAERTSVHAKSVDRSSPPSAPPPIPPRDPVRHAPRSMDVFNLPQHTNGRYVADPTQERISSAMHANSRRCLVSAQSFDSVHSYPDRDVWSGSTPSVFSEQRHAPFRTGWQDNHSGFHVNESVNNARFDNSSDNEVPPPVPRRQPSSAGTT